MIMFCEFTRPYARGYEVMYGNEPPTPSPYQMMLLFILFPENNLHATLEGKHGPLPNTFRLLPLMDFTDGFSLPHCSLIDISLLGYANIGL